MELRTGTLLGRSREHAFSRVDSGGWDVKVDGQGQGQTWIMRYHLSGKTRSSDSL